LPGPVPQQAPGGRRTFAAAGVVSTASAFPVTSPVLAGVLPTSGSQGAIVNLTLSGSRFTAGTTVGFSGTAGDITTTSSPTVSPDGTSMQVSAAIAAGAALGLRDVTVTKPDGSASTLAGGFQVKTPIVAGFQITLPAFADAAAYLPSVAAVSITRDATGKCTSRAVTPTAVQIQAQFVTTTNLAPPQSATFTISPSALPGTATNDDCELDPANPTKDFSIGSPDLASQQVVVAGNGGIYTTTLYAYDWGGKVTITVTGSTSGGPAEGTLVLPIDTDGDDLPDAYENNAGLNADKNGVNVLNFRNPDQDGNGVKDRDDRFAKDGLSNFAKYRGVYLTGPLAGGTGQRAGFQRLGVGLRHLFVRGRGFSDDPAVGAGFCGINFTTGAPVADSTLSAANPCPAFQVGTAYQNIGVAV